MSTLPSGYTGLEIFQPADASAEIAQHAADVAEAQGAVELCEKVRTLASGRISLLEQFSRFQQVQTPGAGGPANELNALETASLAEQAVRTLAFNYEGTVKGWVAYIQTLRSIASRVPGAISPDRLVFPPIPEALAVYAKANGLS